MSSPIIKTLDDMLLRLKDATQALREAERDVAQYTTAIRALIPVLEDEETKTSYQLSLDELSGKPGFVEAIRSILRDKQGPLTPVEIKNWIRLTRKMDLSGYSNAMASLHTSLRRMKDVEEVLNSKGERSYRLLPGSPGVPLLNATDRALEEKLPTVGELRRHAKEPAERGKK